MGYTLEGYNYETWWHDVTRCRDDWAVMVSSKTDHKRSGKDDHMVLIAVFNRDHHLVAARQDTAFDAWRGFDRRPVAMGVIRA